MFEETSKTNTMENQVSDEQIRTQDAVIEAAKDLATTFDEALTNAAVIGAQDPYAEVVKRMGRGRPCRRPCGDFLRNVQLFPAKVCDPLLYATRNSSGR